MLAIEEILCELNGEDINEQGLPPGFRFHPTDEELITFYLASKVFNGTFCGIDIAEVDLNRCEPWELPDVAKMGEREWYFLSLRDRKYPTGLRTNRATGAGYWKATGKDREVYSASSGALLGMKKTLVFYKGRAPRGEKTKWVMHEYRLDGDFSYRHTSSSYKEEWVICRIFHKMGEKKSALLQQGQNYHHLLEVSSSSTETPATLLESQSHNPMQSPFLIQHQESDLKSLINQQPHHHFSIINGFQPPSSSSASPNTIITTTTNKNTDTNHPSPSSLFFKSLLSHQDCSFREEATIPKQCKTEANFIHFQLSDANANLRWADKFNQNSSAYQNPLLFGMDCGGFPSSSSSATAPAPAHEMSTSSVAFNRTAFQMLLDPPNKPLSGESWPLDL